MNKNGFTLVELLVVVILISAIVLLALPKITNSVNNYNTNVDKTTFNIIKEATKLYISDNSNLFVKSSENTYCITLNELIEEDYLKNTIEYNNQDITNTKVMKVTYDNGFNYELVNKKDCKILPLEYQQVEYIESTGTQYIDTGLVGSTPNYKILARVEIIKKTQTANNYFFGVYNGTTYYGLLGIHNNNKYRLLIGKSADIFSDINYELNKQITLELISRQENNLYKVELRIDDAVKIFDYNNYNNVELPLYLFNVNYNGPTGEYGVFRVYNINIEQDWVIKRNFVPCYRKSDGVIGLFDLVENKFYTNSGTGTFIKGKDI